LRGDTYATASEIRKLIGWMITNRANRRRSGSSSAVAIKPDRCATSHWIASSADSAN
jgi:hypothetical protein